MIDGGLHVQADRKALPAMAFWRQSFACCLPLFGTVRTARGGPGPREDADHHFGAGDECDRRLQVGLLLSGERQVAFELADILRRMTGATFDVHALGAKWKLVARDDKSKFGMVSPRGLATDVTGRVYIIEDGSPGTMKVFDRSGGGQAVSKLRSTGGTHWPVGIDVGPRGEIAVAVRTAHGKGEIQLFDAMHRFVSRVRLDEHGGCADVAFDTTGSLWVTSEKDFQVRRFRRDGKLLLTVPDRPGLKRGHGPWRVRQRHRRSRHRSRRECLRGRSR